MIDFLFDILDPDGSIGGVEVPHGGGEKYV